MIVRRSIQDIKRLVTRTIISDVELNIQTTFRANSLDLNEYVRDQRLVGVDQIPLQHKRIGDKTKPCAGGEKVQVSPCPIPGRLHFRRPSIPHPDRPPSQRDDREQPSTCFPRRSDNNAA